MLDDFEDQGVTMKDYCNCGSRKIEQTFLSGGIVFCVDCSQAVCCAAVGIGNRRIAPHPAELANGTHFACWPHSDGVANQASQGA